MTQAEWKRLHDWLFRVLPADAAEEEYVRNVKYARKIGGELPTEDLAR